MSHNSLENLYVSESITPDPGNGGDITQSKGIEVVDITTAGAETRVLKNPSNSGCLTLRMFEDGGDCVITAEDAINQAGNNVITLGDSGDCVILSGVRSSAGHRYQVLANDGATLSTKYTIDYRTMLNWEPEFPFNVTISFPGSAECDFVASPAKADFLYRYYVNGTSGDNANPGTAASPLQTIAAAISKLNTDAVAGEIVIQDTASQTWGDLSPQNDLNVIALSPVVVAAPGGERAGWIVFEKQFYLENLVFEGGDVATFQVNSPGPGTRFTAVNCEFSDSDANGLDWNGGGEVYLISCTADDNTLDGFNYHDDDDDGCFVLEYGCEASGNGTNGSTSNNASTAHDAVSIVRVGGDYQQSPQNIVDIEQSNSINVGVTSQLPVDVSGTQNTANFTSAGLQVVIGGSFTGGDFVVPSPDTVFESFATISALSVSGTKLPAVLGTHYQY